MAELTDKQKRFVQEYLIDCNATQAAIRSGYSQKTAMEQGYQLLQKTSVQNAIQSAMDKRAKRTEVTADKVIEQIARIAFADITQVVTFGPGGVSIKDSAQVDGTILQEVAETTSQTGGSKRVKLNDRMKALELLGRHLGLFDKEKDDNPMDLSDEEIDEILGEAK